MYIIDFHSHILPGIDDGSADISMSDEMIKIARSQGVKVQVLTPHFYAHKMSPEEFFLRRDEAIRQLIPVAQKYRMEIRVGAEVYYFRNMEESDILPRLTINGTRLILIEMPFDQWSYREVLTIEGIIRRGFIPILAHLDRYLTLQRDREAIDRILNMRVITQINCESLDSFFTRRRTLKAIENIPFLLGSDAHNLDGRAPNMHAGRMVILDKMGKSTLQNIDNLGNTILGYKNRTI